MIYSETNHHPVVLEAEFKRLLRLPRDYVYEEEMASSVEWTKTWFAEHSQPWVCACPIEDWAIDGDTVLVGGTRFESRELAKRFRHASSAIVVAASAGVEAETEAARRWENDEPDRYYFMETYASAVVEALITESQARLCAWADAKGKALLPHYSPGYKGWTVGDQAKVHDLVLRGGALPGPIEVMSSGMLRPKKSQLAVFALAPVELAPPSDTNLVPCKHCPHLQCDFRRQPYALAS